MAIYKLINNRAVLFANISTGGGEAHVVGISVTTPPTKTIYTEGESLNLAGMVVKSISSDGRQADITASVTTSPVNGAALTTQDTAVSISWTDGAATFTTSLDISVTEQGATPTSIYVATPPTITSYNAGDSLNLSGMVIKAVWSDSNETVITSAVTTSPVNGAALSTSDTTVTISWTYGGSTFTATQAITVADITLSSIYVSSAPTTTSYTEGDLLDLSGMVVKAVWSNGTETDVTSSVTTSPTDGATLNTTISSVSISYTSGGVTKTTSQAITVSPAAAAIYGMEWTKNYAQATPIVKVRTDDAELFADPVAATSSGSGSSPFDTIQPWAGMTIVDNATYGKVVRIPKYYYKWTQEGDPFNGTRIVNMKLQISTRPFTGSMVSPAHADRGDGVGERNVVYVGRYLTPLYSVGGQGARSITGETPFSMSMPALSAFRTYSDPEIQPYDYAMHMTIAMLYLVEYGEWDSTGAIGTGVFGTTSQYTVGTTGATDNMSYHTGTTGATLATSARVQYRNIEDISSNVDVWCPSVYAIDGDAYVINNPRIIGTDFDNPWTTGGTKVGTIPSASSSSGVATFNDISLSGYEYALIPKQLHVSGVPTYYAGETSGGRILRVGRNTLLGFNIVKAPSNTSASGPYAAMRLQILPNS